MKYKGTVLYRITEPEGTLLIKVNISVNEVISFVSSFTERATRKAQREREQVNYGWHNALRCGDRSWCYQNIPSSIMWKTEIHHSWEDGGVMFLLDPEEHFKITRNERRHK